MLLSCFSMLNNLVRCFLRAFDIALKLAGLCYPSVDVLSSLAGCGADFSLESIGELDG
jgi:hypothetical protein